MRVLKNDSGLSDRARVDVGAPGGFWASATGGSIAVIAIVAVIGLIVVSVYVARLAEHAIDRTPAAAIQKESSP